MPDAEIAESPHKGQRGLRRLFNALLYSLSGLMLAFRHESAFRQEVALAVVLIPLACVLRVEMVERVLLISTVLLVLVIELLNSSTAPVAIGGMYLTDTPIGWPKRHRIPDLSFIAAGGLSMISRS